MGAHHFSNFITKLEEKKIHHSQEVHARDNNHVGSRMSTLQQHYILVSGRSILSLVITTTAGNPIGCQSISHSAHSFTTHISESHLK